MGWSLAGPVAAVSGALSSSEYGLFGHTLGISGQTKITHEVNETGGQIEFVAELAGGVVEGKRVVVVMEAFAWEIKPGEDYSNKQSISIFSIKGVIKIPLSFDT